MHHLCPLFIRSKLPPKLRHSPKALDRNSHPITKGKKCRILPRAFSQPPNHLELKKQKCRAHPALNTDYTFTLRPCLITNFSFHVESTLSECHLMLCTHFSSTLNIIARPLSNSSSKLQTGFYGQP